MIRYLLFYPAELLALLATFALLIRRSVPPRLAILVAAIGILALLVRSPSPEGWDYAVFWRSGVDVLEGNDPYVLRRIACLNPPTALPLFAVFALAPFNISLALWTVVNVAACVLLVPFTWHVLRAQCETTDDWNLSPGAIAVLTSVVAFASVTRFGLEAGQLGLYTAWTIFAAMLAQAKGRPILCGIFLAMATIKTATLLPFLLLFLRKSDRRAWVSTVIVCLGLCLLATPPRELLARNLSCLRNIEALSRPGAVNDYAYSNEVSNDMVALDHLYYRLGVRDRKVIQVAQLSTLALLGAWLAWRTLGPDRLSRPAACSVLTLYSMLFLYHRYYDMVILALPLLYATGRALTAMGRARGFYVLCICAILGVLTLRRAILEFLTRFAVIEDLRGRLVGAIVLPFGDWCLLIALFALVAAEGARQPEPVLKELCPAV